MAANNIRVALELYNQDRKFLKKWSWNGANGAPPELLIWSNTFENVPAYFLQSDENQLKYYQTPVKEIGKLRVQPPKEELPTIQTTRYLLGLFDSLHNHIGDWPWDNIEGAPPRLLIWSNTLEGVPILFIRDDGSTDYHPIFAEEIDKL